VKINYKIKIFLKKTPWFLMSICFLFLSSTFYGYYFFFDNSVNFSFKALVSSVAHTNSPSFINISPRSGSLSVTSLTSEYPY
jgi:hypothetical protein